MARRKADIESQETVRILEIEIKKVHLELCQSILILILILKLKFEGKEATWSCNLAKESAEARIEALNLDLENKRKDFEVERSEGAELREVVRALEREPNPNPDSNPNPNWRW